MDCSTRLYRSYMRPFRDRPDIKVLGRWYWCPEGARPLPFWHTFGSQYGDTFREEFLEYLVGEQVGWHGPNHHQPNPRYTGKHFCGTVQDWQEGALYGQTVQRDWEGVPLCCNTTPLRPGGGVVGGKAPAFTLFQGVWWLNPDVLSAIPPGDPVDLWPTSAGPPNDGICNVNGTTFSNGQGVFLVQPSGLHPIRNHISATHGFQLRQCSWYLVGGGANIFGTVNGPNIMAPTAGYSFIDGLTGLTVNTQHRSITHSWFQAATFGLFSLQFKNQNLSLFLDGVLMASGTTISGDILNVIGFIIGMNPVSLLHGFSTNFNEFLLFDPPLNDVDDWAVLSYLAHKYQIPLGPDPTYFGFEYFAPGWFRPWFFP